MKTIQLDILLKEKLKLSNQQADLFISKGVNKEIGKKDFFIKEGQIALFKGYLRTGSVRVFYTDENLKENIIFFSFEHSWLGDIESYHLQKGSRVSIQAVEDCEILVYSKNTFGELEKKIPKLSRWYEHTALRMYSNIFDKLIESKIRKVEEKYVYLLNQHPEIFKRIPLQYIADYLEIEPQSLSRLRKRILSR